MLQIRKWSKKDNTYIWVDKTFKNLDEAFQYAQEISIEKIGVVVQKVKRKRKGRYHV
jgi:nucleoid DNA-binding protein